MADEMFPVFDNPVASPDDGEPDAEGMARASLVPNRMWIADLDDTKSDNTSVVAQYNPTEFERTIKVEWAKMKSPGLPYRRLQYTGTENPELSFELVFDALVQGQTMAGIQKAHRFMESLCYPRRGATNVKEGEAPRALFVWPEFLSLSCVVNKLHWKYERFDRMGPPTRYTVKVDLEEVRDIRLYLEDVRGDAKPAATLPSGTPMGGFRPW